MRIEFLSILATFILLFILVIILKKYFLKNERKKAIKHIKRIFEEYNIKYEINKYIIKIVINYKTYLINLINLNKDLELIINSDKYIEIFSNGIPKLYNVNLKDRYDKILITFGSNKPNKRYINESDIEICQYNIKYLDSYYVFKIEELKKFIEDIKNDKIQL